MAVAYAKDVREPDRELAYQLRTAELREWEAVLAGLSGADWSRDTVCDKWNVHDIVGHLTGQAEEIIWPWLLPVHDRKAAKAHPELAWLDAHMQLQVDKYHGVPDSGLQDKFADVWPKANRVLHRRPGVLRNRTTKFDEREGARQPRVQLGYLFDVIYLRDLWMHRDDVCQAVGHPLRLDRHDAGIVEQAIRDLGTYYWEHEPIILELTGPAGGTWQLGEGEPVATVRLDAVDYMRTLSGRAKHPEITVVSGDPGMAEKVAAARVPF